MANIKLQDFTATIHRTSRHNGGLFDLIHVETLIESDQPIPPEDTWFIPNAKPIDPMFKSMFESNQITLTPIHNSKMMEKINSASDILTQAQEQNQEETKKDIITLAYVSVMSKTVLKPIENTASTYILTYDYKLYPIAPNVFELKLILPFPGFEIPDNGDEVKLTIVAPIGATIDPNETKGIDQNGASIPAQILISNTSKQIVSFNYRIDPLFTIRYSYPS